MQEGKRHRKLLPPTAKERETYIEIFQDPKMYARIFKLGVPREVIMIPSR